jgi:mannose-6-phosphate isomerase-like protein (cupin superfamily)
VKVIKRNQAKEYQNSDNCGGFEFDLGDKNLDGAVVKVTGRYPEKGNAVNTECKEIAYIIDGKGMISIKGEVFDIEGEDLIIIDKGEEYYWDGEFKLFVYCTPAWTPKQHKAVD